MSQNLLMVFDAHKTSLEEFTQLLRDRSAGTLQGVTPQQADEKIRQIFCEIAGISEKPTRTEVQKALRRQEVRLDVFEVIEEILPEMILTGWQDSPFFDEYVEVKNLALGDRNEFRVNDDTILTVSKISRGNWAIERQRLGRGKTFAVPMETYAVAIYAEAERVMMGAENWADLVDHVRKAMIHRLNQDLYNAFQSASTQLPASANLTPMLSLATPDDSRDKLVELVTDVGGLNRSGVTIVGTHTGIAKLQRLDDIAWRSEKAKEDLYLTGKLGFWMGTPLVEIPQVYVPGTTTRMLADDKLFVLPTGADNKFLKVCYEGAALIREITEAQENLDMSYEYYYVQNVGVAAALSKVFGLVTLTA